MNHSDLILKPTGFRRFLQHKRGAIGLICFIFIVLGALLFPLLSPYTYFENHLALKNLPPSTQFWFGTDELGRDLFTRVWYGARISLLIGLVAASVDLIVGVLYGSIAAFMGKKTDEILMRIADILHSIPYLLVVILLTVSIGSGILTIILALTITGWINMARIVRGQILQLKELDYINAARMMGASKGRIIFKHLIPNTIGPIITMSTLTVISAIFAEAFLSFLGLGVQAPIASWGTMANDGLSAMRYYPWRLFFPAFFISLTMLSLNLIGDALRDWFDTRIEL